MESTATLVEQFRRHVKRRPDGPCLIEDDRPISWAEVEARSSRVAQELQERGVSRGDTVGLLLRNTSELVLAFLAVQMLGAVTSCMNTRISAGATVATVEKEQQRLLICGPSFQEVATHDRLLALPTDVLVVAESGDWGKSGPAASEIADPHVSSADVCNVIHTSGTTGVPKGAAFTHATQTLSGLQYALEMGVDRQRIGLTAAPIVIGAATNFFACYTLVVGAPLVLLSEPKAEAVLEAVGRHGVTELFAVPTQLRQLVDVAEQRGTDVSTLRAVRTGGSPVAVDLIRDVRRVLGAEVLNTYGTTESCTAITVMHSGIDPERAWASIGKASYFQEVKVERDAETGRGQLLNRGPQSASTIYLEPQRPLFNEDGWQETRDVVEVDEEGYLYIVDRVDNVIISGGENIYPQPIEQVLVDSGRYRDVAITSVPDREWGERIVALVVPLDEGQEVTLEEIEEICLASDDIPRHWRPRQIHIVEELPRNILGKLDRVQLGERLSEAAPGSAGPSTRH